MVVSEVVSSYSLLIKDYKTFFIIVMCPGESFTIKINQSWFHIDFKLIPKIPQLPQKTTDSLQAWL